MFDDSAYQNKPGYIYLIHAKGTKRFKIGLTTRSVTVRFTELNGSQSPYPLELIEVIQTDNVTTTEGYLHDKYRFQRRHGEWFEFDNRQLKEVLKEFDRLQNGNQGWFRFPSFPSISLPTMPQIEVDTNFKGLVITGIGIVWLLIGYSCHQAPQAPQVPQASQVK